MRMRTSKLPSASSLVELCIRNAIDNLDRIGDVGHTDSAFLEIILPHCNASQLKSIEDASQERDLSSITNQLWKRCYRRKFGEDSANLVEKRIRAKLKESGRTFKWRALYEAKIMEQEEVNTKCANRLREKYKEADEKKASRQLQQIDLTPPGSKKRKIMGGGGGSTSRFGGTAAVPAGGRGRLMKKAKKDFAASFDGRRSVVRR